MGGGDTHDTEPWLAGEAMSSPPPALLRHLLKGMSGQMAGWISPIGEGQGNPVAITACILTAHAPHSPSEATSLPL